MLGEREPPKKKEKKKKKKTPEPEEEMYVYPLSPNTLIVFTSVFLLLTAFYFFNNLVEK